mgnify:CR=1 FL=1|jgi:hypothetical protein|nr:MAG TPA: deoxynucleoside monophosphate kinase [Caudoviricetes sp.]
MIIGIVGKAGVGKDTAAQILSKLKNMPIASFARPLHEAAKFVFGNDCLERDKKETPMPFGTCGFGNFYENWLIPFLETDEVRLITKDDKSFLQRPFPVFTDPRNGRFYQELSPRKFMQLLGTEYFRFCMDEFFIHLMQNSYENVIIPDVRFENEAAICDLLIGIHRDVPSVNVHSSEEFAELIIDDNDDGQSGTVKISGGKWHKYLIVYNTYDISDLEQKLQKHVDFGNI